MAERASDGCERPPGWTGSRASSGCLIMGVHSRAVIGSPLLRQSSAHHTNSAPSTLIRPAPAGAFPPSPAPPGAGTVANKVRVGPLSNTQNSDVSACTTSNPRPQSAPGPGSRVIDRRVTIQGRPHELAHRPHLADDRAEQSRATRPARTLGTPPPPSSSPAPNTVRNTATSAWARVIASRPVSHPDADSRSFQSSRIIRRSSSAGDQLLIRPQETRHPLPGLAIVVR